QPPNFNRLARAYRWMEYATFGPSLSLARNAFLPQLATRRHALVLGDGDGRFTARLLRTNASIHVHAVDASPAMLSALILQAGPHAARVQTEQADIRSWHPKISPGENQQNQSRVPLVPRTWGPAIPADASNPSHLGTSDSRYDAIFTHFFLDSLTTEQVQSLAVTLRAVTSPSALWVVSEFAIPSGWYGRLIARPLVWSLYRAFAWLTGLAIRTLPDHNAALRAAGFTRYTRRSWLGGLLIGELWSAAPPEHT
ncbi:MAG: class I SAM-dependent methyltransferase, partial [Terracidiphilus sp.]